MSNIEARTQELGKVFGHWRIDSLLGTGSGGRSAVFAISHTEAGSVKRALKVVSLVEERGRPETQSEAMRSQYESHREACRSRAEQEVLLMDGLKGNTNIVDYEDHCFIDWSDGESYGRDMLIRMELLSDLREKLRIGRSFSRDEIIAIGTDICTALELCHKNNILHRDIKPENIFVNRNGSWKLGDFGISRILDSSQGYAATGVGTPQYWAAEQAAGNYDQRADIYSLGLVLYELSNDGRLPFAETRYVSPEATSKRLSGLPLPKPVCADEALAAVILKACAHRAEDRYAGAADFREALAKAAAVRVDTPPAGNDPYSTFYAADDEAAAGHEPGPKAGDPSRGGIPKKKVDKKKSRLIAAVLLCICIMGVTVSAALPKGEKEETPAAVPTPTPVHSAQLPQHETAEPSIEGTVVPLPDAGATPTPAPAATPLPAMPADIPDPIPDYETENLDRNDVVSQAADTYNRVQTNWRSYDAIHSGDISCYFENGQLLWVIDRSQGWREYYFVKDDARFILVKDSAESDTAWRLYCYKGQLTELMLPDASVEGPGSDSADYLVMSDIALSAGEVMSYAYDLAMHSDPEILTGDGVSVAMGDISSILASSCLKESSVTHSPERLVDGNVSTAWVEGVAGQGEGEMVTFKFTDTRRISGITIWNGYQSKESSYTGNSRPKTLDVILSDGSIYSYELADIMGAQTLEFPSPSDVTYIQLVIDSVYPGSLYTDTCISEIELW